MNNNGQKSQNKEPERESVKDRSLLTKVLWTILGSIRQRATTKTAHQP